MSAAMKSEGYRDDAKTDIKVSMGWAISDGCSSLGSVECLVTIAITRIF